MGKGSSLARPQQLYERDFYAWTVEQATALRSGQLRRVDLEHVAEEVEDMGKSQRRAVKSALTVILIRLLKYRYWPDHRSNNCRATLRERRRRVRDGLADSPSLRPYVEQVLGTCYQDARKAEADESGVPRATFSAVCPFSENQILDRGVPARIRRRPVP